MSLFSHKNAHLVSALGRVLTKGNVDQVVLVDHPACPMNVREVGAVKSKVVMPTRDQWPEGFTEQACHGILDHELAHGCFTTGDGLKIDPLEWPEFAEPTAMAVFQKTAEGLHNTLEDRRIEPLYAQRFPGGGENIDALNQYALQHWVPEVLNGPHNTLIRKVDQALNAMLLHGQTRKLEELDTWAHEVTSETGVVAIEIATELFPKASEGLAKATCSQDLDKVSCELTSDLLKRIPQQDFEQEQQNAQAQERIQQALKRLKQLIEGTGVPQEASGAIGDLSQFGGGLEKANGIAGLLTERVPKAEVTPEEVDALQEAVDSGLLLPSYASKRHRITDVVEGCLGQDTMIRLDPDAARYAQIKSTLGSSIAALTRTLRLHLESLSRTHTAHEREEGAIDAPSLFKLAVGSSRNVFTTRQVHPAKETAVSILCDLSGSMLWGEKLPNAIKMCVALAEAFKLLHIDYEVLGFTTKGEMSHSGPREAVTHYIAKSFADRNAHAISAFNNVEHHNNADPDAIRWAARRLLAHAADRRLLVVISDGQPACSIRLRRSSETLQQDLRCAIQACLKSGIEVLGIGVEDDYVQEFYPWYAVVEDASSLSQEVLSALSKGLTSSRQASLQKMATLTQR